jgi:hypothetical protein
MTNIWKASVGAGGTAAGILAVLAAIRIDHGGTSPLALGMAALAVGMGAIFLALRSGAAADEAAESRIVGLTIFLLTLALGLMLGAGSTGGHGHG